MVGNFSDSESATDDVAKEMSPRAEMSPRGGLSPRARALLTQSRAASTAITGSIRIDSPLPNIDAGSATMGYSESGARGAGDSPGLESNREYSESDDDLDTPGGGMLKGERLIP